MRIRNHLAPIVAALLAGLAPTPAHAQADAPSRGWNSERTLELVARGREARTAVARDTVLQSYEATARGHLYFLVDRQDREERTLVKADQLALELYWMAPDRVRQRIVGRRDERKLPTTIQYHLDHLTVVTDDFSDRITLGDGDEIRSVVHPLSPASGDRYDFRLADSTTIRFPGLGESVRVYEVEVRPRDAERPGFVGSVFLDRATAAVVRLAFTFTPSSYVDPYLDYIRIVLENGRWQGRYWLPHRQEVEIRRELPQLDFPAGSVIQGRWEIGDYRFNTGLADAMFRGPRITTLSDGALSSYRFDEGLYEPLEQDGLVPTPDVRRIRRHALQVAGERYLSGLRRLRLFLPSASAAVRYNRAEGLYVGSGFSYRPTESLAMRVNGGYAFGRERASLSARVTGGGEAPTTGVRAFWNDLRDLGPLSAASGVGNSFAVLATETDFLDPYFVSGATAHHTVGGGQGPEVELALRWERHSAAENVVADPGEESDLRPVRQIQEGVDRALDVTALAGSVRGGVSARLRLTAGRFEDDEYAGLRGTLGWHGRWLERDVEVDAELRGGVASRGAPVQNLFHLGGRRTLPGYGHRAFAGDRFWLARIDGSWGVAAPWLRARAFGSAGWAALGQHALPREWNARPTPIPVFSAGIGAGLLWDILRVDLARGLNGGEWVTLLSINHDFWSWL